MIKKLLGGLFKKEKIEESNFIVATLNDKIMPIDRGEIYEDPLDELLVAENIGEVSGGGTMQEKSGEIDYCDVEIKLNGTEIDRTVINKIIEKLENLGAPKGSVMNVEKTQEKINFGKLEGIGIYLDGTNLPKNVYEECDINFVITEIHRLTETEYIVNRNWENENGIALYFYGQSFDKMKTQIKEFVESYPLCENCRIEKIA
ncbi:hypothetical protein O8E88_002243 [Flavobacterium psychrophilum]|uniref:hypothetical protein n=1 Tax=Flavobacterium psychrophilum TaxID=96345 RepID=UPI0004F6EAA0|nr:hypothetical protein [Flavobacterium psychrophilum]AIN74095.1 hypothetical protein FPG3_06965 [Flavobacterium psychrophilum FPG3]EKT2070416.1 hypothetical protein [Flavobacterium psychrophilum]EKT2072826.1 hypothetical protein [Flavobacterium psychrophilum]EKT4492236.1 hypothetical protein [Flavobacterium psychrophilum]MBF2045572.1 hypothetical protein [Flavobacterium psychrophilum]